MSTVYREPVEMTTGTGTADFPALAQSVRFVYRLDEPGASAEALTDPRPAAAGSRLCLPTLIHHDALSTVLGANDSRGGAALPGVPKKLSNGAIGCAGRSRYEG